MLTDQPKEYNDRQVLGEKGTWLTIIQSRHTIYPGLEDVQ